MAHVGPTCDGRTPNRALDADRLALRCSRFSCADNDADGRKKRDFSGTCGTSGADGHKNTSRAFGSEWSTRTSAPNSDYESTGPKLIFHVRCPKPFVVDTLSTKMLPGAHTDFQLTGALPESIEYFPMFVFPPPP